MRDDEVEEKEDMVGGSVSIMLRSEDSLGFLAYGLVRVASGLGTRLNTNTKVYIACTRLFIYC